jgi:glyoxylase-like metal-dependent hydrolase (beta-lactamase superfamily II)
MFPLTRDTGYVDLNFREVPGVIATGVLTGPDGVTLVDPGPTSCLATLRRQLELQGIAFSDLKRILLTHIHLDHAGATGTLVQEQPHLEVFVHERGARHLIDPAKLLDSATRLYGAMMNTLWGAVLPVPASNVRVLQGGEAIRIDARPFKVEYTPGHASHHVSYFDTERGIAWVGDTAGVSVGGTGFVIPPTPPPDIDLELWSQSLGLIRSWQADRLVLTHFGVIERVADHLATLEERLPEVADLVRQSLSRSQDPEAQFAAFRDDFSNYIRRSLSEHEAALLEAAAPLRYNWQGLQRYWTKRAAATSSRS